MVHILPGVILLKKIDAKNNTNLLTKC